MGFPISFSAFNDVLLSKQILPVVFSSLVLVPYLCIGISNVGYILIYVHTRRLGEAVSQALASIRCQTTGSFAEKFNLNDEPWLEGLNTPNITSIKYRYIQPFII